MTTFARGDAHLLEITPSARGARVSLSPIRGASLATLSGYEEIDIDRRELDRLIVELRIQLGRANARGVLDRATAEEVRKTGHLLFDELLPPSIKDWLRQRQGGDLLIRTDESLVDVPWEMLHTGVGYLAMQMNVGRLIAACGATTPVAPRSMAAPYSALVLADPCGDLDAAYEEGIRLRDLLDGQPWLRVALQSSEIPRATLRENAREFDILHFAGHAEVGGQGEGWLMSDGRFSAEDVDRLNGGRPFPALVFANACGSGRSSRAPGGSASTWSLARAFLNAGVRHFIGTHWDVPDQIAGEFSEHFYRNLCAGLSIGDALRKARVALSRAHGEGTILWGAYCLYGDPHHVYFPEGAQAAAELDPLPVLALDPEVARGVYHTIEAAPLHEATRATSEGLGLNPSLRNEAVLTPSSLVGEGVRDLTRALRVAAAVAVTLLLVAVVHQTWKQFSAREVEETGALALQSEPPSSSKPALALAVEEIREQEAVDRRAPPKIKFEARAQTRSAQRDVIEVSVTEGTRLHGGDNLRVSVQSDRDAYVALIMIDGKHRPQLLFPHPSVRTPAGDHIPAGARVELPGADLWYRLDKQPGVETLLLLADKKPIEGLGPFLDEIEALGKVARSQRAESGGVVIRGVGGVTAEGRAGRARQEPGAVRTRQLSEIQRLARDHGVEVIQAITYVHLR